MDMLRTTRCVVLNTTYEPLSIVAARRGLRLVLMGKAEITKELEGGVVGSNRKNYPIPIEVKLKEFVKGRPAFRIPATLTQQNLFVRDMFTCQYCGRHKSELGHGQFLTREHIVPRTRGGADTWSNVVTACNTCNNKKADFSLAELKKMGEDMELKRAPWTPTVFEIWSRKSLRPERIKQQS